MIFSISSLPSDVLFILISILISFSFLSIVAARTDMSASESLFEERSRMASDESCSRSTTERADVASEPRLFPETLRRVTDWLSRRPSRSMRPPSSVRRLRRMLRSERESLERRALPRYLPPSAWIWLSATLREVRTDLVPRSFARRRTPWFVILLWDTSRWVIVEDLYRPVISMRRRSSSMRLPLRTTLVRFSLSFTLLARQEASEIFMPKRRRSKSMPILFMLY
mmetsp:Transcript_18290/g.34004  ORF Transcript_18290/g.34004 Transcript_18290/m.34004 type:complete len:226 (-) Transcript_18290:719-1396(-)